MCFTTGDDRRIDVRDMCPKTIQVLADTDISHALLKELARRDPAFAGWGPDDVPWIAPLRELAKKKDEMGWGPKQKRHLQARVAGGLFPPARLASMGVCNQEGPIDELCLLCGEVGTQHHRDFICLSREFNANNTTCRMGS